MKLYLAFYRFGEKERPEKDVVFITTDRDRYARWFKGPEFDGFRRYGHELSYRTEQFSPGQVQDYIYRGGPGV